MSGSAFNTKNLSRLLLSEDNASVALGMTMLSETPLYVEFLSKELWLIKRLHRNEDLQAQADHLLSDALPKEKQAEQNQALRIFQLLFDFNYHEQTWKDFQISYRSVEADYDPLIAQNTSFKLRILQLADRQLSTLERFFGNKPNEIEAFRHPLFWYEKAVSMGAGQGKAHFKMAYILQEKYFKIGVKLNRLSDAVEGYKQAIELGYYPDLCYHNLGQLFENYRKDWKNAKAAYRSALEINPNYTACLNHLSQIHLRKEKDFIKAMSLTNKALQIKPHFAQALMTKGDILIAKNGDLLAAKNLYHQAVSLDQHNTQVLNAMGDLLYFHFQQREQARTFYLQSVQVSAHDSYALKMIQTIENDLGQFPN